MPPELAPSAAPPRGPTAGGTDLALLIVPAALTLAMFGKVLLGMGRQWYDDENYSHGFLIPVMSAYLIYERRGQLASTARAPSLWGIPALAGALAVLLLGAFGAELFLQRASFIAVLAALVLLTTGVAYLRVLAFPLAFLLFMVPLPTIVMNAVAFPLQLLAARVATATLHLAEVPVLREGNVILLPGTTLEVAEACSGIRSLQALLALGAMYAYFFEHVTWKRWALVALSVPIAIFANVVRVAGTGLLVRWSGVEAAEGFYHSFSGWLVFVLAFAILAGASAGLRRIGARRPRPAKAAANNATNGAAVDPPPPRANRPTRSPARALWPVGLATTLLGATWVLLLTRGDGERVPMRRPLSSLPMVLADRWEGEPRQLDREVLDTLRLSDYLLRSYKGVDSPASAPGVELYVGYYESQRSGATYHSPRNCLPGSGWQITSNRLVEVDSPRGRATINAVLIEKGLDRQVMLYWYQDRGRIVASEYWAKAYLIWDAITHNRTDGAMVRLALPVTSRADDAVEQAIERARGFLADAWRPLTSLLPAAGES